MASHVSHRRSANAAWPSPPPAQGLYDPKREHDACGVGFVADLKGRPSHTIVQQGLQLVENLTHRGAAGADPLAGDGAGMLVQIPHEFLKEACATLGIKLPEPGHYAVGQMFMPRNRAQRIYCEQVVTRVVEAEGLKLLGWRDVPTNNSCLSETVIVTEPAQRQVFIGRGPGIEDEEEFERRLYILRKVISNTINGENGGRDIGYYTVSLSCRTLVYKGMFLAYQLGAYYSDLHHPKFASALVLVHQRFSTNTFPSWKLAHPYRMVAHNGEINTLRGNLNWMAARQASVSSSLFGPDIAKLWPISYEGQSDTACFDNALEFLVQGGYSLAHAAMMLIPEAWAGNPLMDAKRRAFYEYHACLMEPWDGPAAMAFTDGRQIGATLDRNGLRPARYLVTKDGPVSYTHLRAHETEVNLVCRLLLEIDVQQLRPVRERRKRRVGAHGADRLLTGLGHGLHQELEALLRVTEGLLAIEQTDIGAGRQCGIARQLVHADLRAIEPLLIGMGVSQLSLDLFVGDDASLLQVDEQHLAGLKPPFLHYVLLRDRQHAGLRRHDDQAILGDEIARGTKTVTVERGADLATVGESHCGGAVPRLHEAGVIFVEGAPFGIHQRIAGPGLGDQHHRRMRE